MRRLRLLFAAVLIVVLSVPAFAGPKEKEKGLAGRIDALLEQPEISRGFWGIEIVDLDTGRTVYSHDAEKLFTPASNTKLFTTAATLALIGPDYRFRTTMESNGTIDKYGRLNGDLVLVGRGDPNLSGRVLPYSVKTERTLPATKILEDMADQIAARGVKVIDGNIVGDDSYYVYERYGEGWSQDDLVFDWGAPVSALTINDNVIFVSILPGANVGDKAFINITPFPEYYKIDNRVTTTPAGTGPRKLYASRQPGSETLTLYGTIPVDDPGASQMLAIDNPAKFAAELMYQLLEQRGIAIYGKPVTKHTDLSSLSTFSVTTVASAGGGQEARKPMAPQPTVLAEHVSMPLADDVKVTNKVSQNLHAELMLRLLGKIKGTSGSIEGGLEVERGWLTQADIRPDEYVFYDGSGLSRQNLVTPHAIVKLLTYASKQPWGQTYIDSFPVGGVDGTLVDRFKSAVMLGRVHAKTGSLGHVNALSGFATTLKGQHIVFSILTNNHMLTGKQAHAVIDQIVTDVVEGKK